MLALTHPPSPDLDLGQRTHITRQAVDFAQALEQHATYCRVLRECGCEVRTLEVNRDFPDGTFIEDTAVILDEVAVLASMGTEARRGEPARLVAELQAHRPVRRLELPATLEGGDVLVVGRTILVGLSSRTNAAGLEAFEAIVRPHGYRVRPVAVRGCLHLKTACTALPDGSLLANPAWLEVEALAGLPTVTIAAEEPWGANTLPIDGCVCLPAEHVRTADLLRRRGFDVRPIPLSEFAKVEGGVTCLSLRLGGRTSPFSVYSSLGGAT